MTEVLTPDVLPTSVDGWVERIQVHMRRGVEAVLAMADDLEVAASNLEHGEMAELAACLGMSDRTVRRIRSIAAVSAFRPHVAALPPSYSTLAELAGLSDEQLEEAIREGTVRPDMERKDAAALVKRVKQVADKQPDPEPPAGSTDAEARDAVYRLQRKLPGYQELKKRAGRLLAQHDWEGTGRLCGLASWCQVNRRRDLLDMLEAGAPFAQVDGLRLASLGDPNVSDEKVSGSGNAPEAGDPSGASPSDIPAGGGDGAALLGVSTPSPATIDAAAPPDEASTSGETADASEEAAVTPTGPAASDEADERVSVHDRPRLSMGTSTVADLSRRTPSGSGRKVSREMLVATRSAVADAIAAVETIDPWSVEGVQQFGDEAAELHAQAVQLLRWASTLEMATRPAEGGRS